MLAAPRCRRHIGVLMRARRLWRILASLFSASRAALQSRRATWWRPCKGVHRVREHVITPPADYYARPTGAEPGNLNLIITVAPCVVHRVARSLGVRNLVTRVPRVLKVFFFQRVILPVLAACERRLCTRWDVGDGADGGGGVEQLQL